MPMDRINALLPNLSLDELRMLSGRVRALMEVTPENGQVLEVDDDEGFVLGCIAEQLSRMSIEYVSMKVLRSQRGIAAFRDKVPGLMKYLSSNDRSRIEQRAILSMGVELLYENLIENGIPVSARMLMAHVHRIPSVLNAAFPGYAKAGLLTWVVKKRLERRGGSNDQVKLPKA